MIASIVDTATRARGRLLVTATEPASEFLDDLMKVS